jgi:hypothetical protein
LKTALCPAEVGSERVTEKNKFILYPELLTRVKQVGSSLTSRADPLLLLSGQEALQDAEGVNCPLAGSIFGILMTG